MGDDFERTWKESIGERVVDLEGRELPQCGLVLSLESPMQVGDETIRVEQGIVDIEQEDQTTLVDPSRRRRSVQGDGGRRDQANGHEFLFVRSRPAPAGARDTAC